MSNKLIEDEIIFSTITGSHAYGMNIESSDVDTRGIAIRNDKGYYFGFLKIFEQQEDNLKDDVIYDIRKSIKMMADNNPSMLELLFVDEKFYKKTSKYWNILLENRDKFLSKNVRHRYLGYSHAQLKRIKTARGYLLNPPKSEPTRKDFGLPDSTSLMSKQDLGAYHWVLANLLEDSIEFLNFSEATKEELLTSNFIGAVQRKGIPNEIFNEVQKITGASDQWMSIMRKEQSYINARRSWQSYQSWKANRNKKRAVLEEKFGFDCKHASHLVRLLRQGEEILTTGKLLVYRSDREELLFIRNGGWSFEQVEQYAEDMQNKIDVLHQNSYLPNAPDRVFLDNLCIDLIEKFLKDNA